jgi:Flp pilus assembly protein TadG
LEKRKSERRLTTGFNGSLTLFALRAIPKVGQLTEVCRMIGFFRRLLKDRRGSALAIACACMPLVIGAAGLATDTIEWTLWKRQLQRAADSAAFAGVYDRAAASGATTNTSTAVCADLSVNLHTWMSLIGTSPCTGTVGSYTTLSYPNNTTYVTNQVTVTLKVQQSLPFSSMFMSAAPVITASATAGSVAYGGNPCMLALNKSGTAIDNSGNTTVNAPTCIFYSDSASSNSAAAGGNSSVTAKAIAGVGGIASSNNWVVNQYLPYSPSLADPFAPPSSTAVTPDPSDMKCAGHWVAAHGQNPATWVNDALTDGVDITTMRDANGNQANCFTSLSVGANRTLSIPNTYAGGPIYINGGNVDLQGAFSCPACTIVLTNNDPSPTATIGTFSSNAQATNNITAPTSGAYKGIAVYQDRRATGNIDKINGGSGNVISGVVYFPKDTLWLNGTGSAVSLCSMFVANNLKFNGTGNIAISSASDAPCTGILQNTATTTVVRLVA